MTSTTDMREHNEVVFEREIQTRWAWKWIDDRLCIGMDGNLDTTHDATLMITGGFLNNCGDSEPAELLAQHLVDQHNMDLL